MPAPNGALLKFIVIPDRAYRWVANICEHLWGRLTALCALLDNALRVFSE